MKALFTKSIVVIFLSLTSFVSCSNDLAVNSGQSYTDRLKFVTDSIVANSQVPGIVALVVDHKKGVDWLYAAGRSDISQNLPANTDHNFRIGSNTKTFTGTVLLQLVDEGSLNLNDKLSVFFPAFLKADSITVAMLCNMTTGIFNYTDDEAFQNQVMSDPSKVWTPQELVNVGFSRSFYFEPGTDWKYSNTNTIILGMIIEQLTGHTLQYEINNRIIAPLMLSNTGFLTSGLDLPGTHGRGYYAGTYEENLDMTEFIDVSWVWSAGSGYSKPRELQKYAEALVGGGLLSDSLQQKRLNDMRFINPVISYGLCLAKRGTFYGHNGSLPGYTSSMYHSKDKDCTVIIYYNCELSVVPDDLFFLYMKILYGDNY